MLDPRVAALHVALHVAIQLDLLRAHGDLVLERVVHVLGVLLDIVDLGIEKDRIWPRLLGPIV